MELPPNKYNTSFIYAIRSPHTDKFYIGSTILKLSRRFSLHKSNFKLYNNGDEYRLTSSFKIIELGDAYIELLEQMNCDNRSQLNKREGDLIRLHKGCCVNQRTAGRNQKDYYEDNVDKIKQQKKEYYEDNVDKIKQRMNQYNKDNADKIKQQKKEYYEANADKIKQQMKNYYEASKQKSK